MDYVPGREADFVPWLNNLVDKIVLQPTVYGITVPQSTTLDGLRDSYIALYDLCADRDTRTPSKVVAKQESRATLTKEVRKMVGIIQEFPGTTNEMRSDLNIPIRDVSPTSRPAPAMRPTCIPGTVNGRTVSVLVQDPNDPSRRGRPPGVDGIAVMTCLGEEPSEDPTQWFFQGNVTRMKFDIIFPQTVPDGTKAWISCFFFNEKKQSGPASLPAWVIIQGGSVELPQAG